MPVDEYDFIDEIKPLADAKQPTDSARVSDLDSLIYFMQAKYPALLTDPIPSEILNAKCIMSLNRMQECMRYLKELQCLRKNDAKPKYVDGKWYKCTTPDGVMRVLKCTVNKENGRVEFIGNTATLMYGYYGFDESDFVKIEEYSGEVATTRPMTNRELADWLNCGFGQYKIGVGGSIRSEWVYCDGDDDEPVSVQNVKIRSKGEAEWREPRVLVSKE
ncbi:MAG: hypothetical protein MJZ25_08845 [Fibrobacter sp.]|nr:hypothetical protein [Fibrobacter sp.]